MCFDSQSSHLDTLIEAFELYSYNGDKHSVIYIKLINNLVSSAYAETRTSGLPTEIDNCNVNAFADKTQIGFVADCI